MVAKATSAAAIPFPRLELRFFNKSSSHESEANFGAYSNARMKWGAFGDCKLPKGPHEPQDTETTPGGALCYVPAQSRSKSSKHATQTAKYGKIQTGRTFSTAHRTLSSTFSTPLTTYVWRRFARPASVAADATQEPKINCARARLHPPAQARPHSGPAPDPLPSRTRRELTARATAAEVARVYSGPGLFYMEVTGSLYKEGIGWRVDVGGGD